MSFPRLRPAVFATLCALGASALASELPLGADTYVSSAAASANYGLAANLSVGPAAKTLLRFDLGALPQGIQPSQVLKASLVLYANRVTTPGAIEVQTVGGAWNESTVNASTAPVNERNISVPTAAVSAANQYVVVDVTEQVAAWVARGNGTNFGFAVQPATDDPSTTVLFDSKENTLTGHAARLDLILGSAGSAGGVGAQGPKGDTGMTGPTGPQGAAGPQGPKGDTGATGMRGATGLTGPAGPQGAKGDAGAAGPAGASGAAGATGPAGPQGLQGMAGAVGPTGPAGPQGLPGPAGTTGLFGSRTSIAAAGNGTDCTMGQVTLVAGYVGNGVPANGAILSIAQNPELFSLLGTEYGGDGQTSFALPNLRAAAPNGTTYFICDRGVYPSRR